ncbi:MAG TPA: hypothetical protein VK978_04135 [Candidatus Saccharimonadales bacterium]|nr:hypothetical protein [Candidatus Saccharimonadales bacterium]
MSTDHLVLHAQTQASLQQFIDRPAHAVLILGAPGSGKQSLARHLAAVYLNVPQDHLDAHPYWFMVQPVDGKAIPIDSIRELQRHTSLKIPGKAAIARILVIDSAHLLTTEAQNALLKTLEEPPLDTVILMTASSADALLPTIQSRVRTLQVTPPASQELRQHCLAQGYDASAIDKALMLSGGLPGLTLALLAEQDTHPLYEATAIARTLLQSTAYGRLVQVDALSKQKQLCQDICFILGEMARMSLVRTADMQSAAAQRWQRVLRASFVAQGQLRTNTHTKLVLINLMLAF